MLLALLISKLKLLEVFLLLTYNFRLAILPASAVLEVFSFKIPLYFPFSLTSNLISLLTNVTPSGKFSTFAVYVPSKSEVTS